MFTTRPEIRGTFGVVASTHWLASAAGMAILERGGNAFDAAVAAGFALQVVEPHLNGPGGEVPIIYHDAGKGETAVICGQGTAPAGATIAHYRGLGLELVPGSGLLATVIPGAFDAWMLMLRDHGTLKLADVLGHAIGYAERGYPLVSRISDTIERVSELFRSEWTSSAALYLRGGVAPQPGTIFRNPLLAQTYRRIIAEAEAASSDREEQIEAARRAWYRGFVAEEIGRYCRETEVMDTSEKRNRGVLTAEDMAGWTASKEPPIGYEYHGWTLYKGGPWSQGPVFLQQLALLKGFDLDGMNPVGPEFVHLVTEAAKLAFADREAFYGDPNYVEVPLERLLSEDYNAARRKLISEGASLELRPGEVPGFGGGLDYALKDRGIPDKDFDALGSGEPTVQSNGAEPSPRAFGGTRGDTCHVDVIDAAGNMVGATPSGGWLQSSPVIPELGFCLNSRAQMFWLEEGVPASLQPGKRPRTTLSVNLAFKDGEPRMVFGTPGGDYQDQWSLTFFLRHAHHGLGLQEAIEMPMFQNDHMPSSFWPRNAKLGSLTVEDRLPAETVRELRRRGHRAEIVDSWSLGRLSAAARYETKEGHLLAAAANPRFMQGYAIGR